MTFLLYGVTFYSYICYVLSPVTILVETCENAKDVLPEYPQNMKRWTFWSFSAKVVNNCFDGTHSRKRSATVVCNCTVDTAAVAIPWRAVWRSYDVITPLRNYRIFIPVSTGTKFAKIAQETPEFNRVAYFSGSQCIVVEVRSIHGTLQNKKCRWSSLQTTAFLVRFRTVP